MAEHRREAELPDAWSGFGVTFRTMFPTEHRGISEKVKVPRGRATTAATSSTAGPTGWRAHGL